MLTTHCGSLPRPEPLVALLAARELREPYDAAVLAQHVNTSVRDVVQRQLECGIDVVNDREHSRPVFRAMSPSAWVD